MKKILFLWMIAVMLIATSCNDNQPSTQQIAISKVANYAQNGNQAPTIQDYIDAGVGGVNADTIDDVNGLILGLEREDVDTATEIQAIIDRLGINLEENITAGDIANQINETNTTDEENVSTSPNEDNETNASETFVPPSEETNTSEPSIDESKPATQENTTNESENNTTTPQEETNETNASETSVPPKEETNTTIENNETNQSVVTPPSEETNTTEENTTIEQPQEETNTTEETNTSTPPVAVVDTTPPTITILGTNPITIEALSSYSDEGATVDEDNSTLNQSGEVNTSKVGVYTITYKAVDSSGNVAEANRTVNVVDTTKPTLALNGNASLTLTKGSVYTELGAKANDNLDGELNVSISGSVNTSSDGTCTLTYKATDKSGNEATTTRSVSVYTPYTPPPADTTPPVITLNGANPVNLYVGDSYSDAEATTNEGTISTSGSVDTATIGVYTITYSATDGSGNSANKTRTINVLKATPTLANTTLSVDENATSGTVVGSVTLSDEGNSSITNYELNISTPFAISSLGVISVNGALDYESQAQYTFEANATNGAGTSQSVTLTININDILHAPQLVESVRIDTFTHSGNMPWIEDSTTSHSAPSSWASGDINDSQTSCIQSDINLTSDKDISFYHKTSSGVWDYLKFYIDGFQQESWYGTNDWSLYSQSLSSGNYMLKWCYTKDSSGSEGSDRVWVDDIHSVKIVAEDLSVGSTLDTIESVDINDSEIDHFTITGEGSENFEVSPSGILSIAQKLDYETQREYSLTIQAHNDAGTSNSVEYRVVVSDIDDLYITGAFYDDNHTVAKDDDRLFVQYSQFIDLMTIETPVSVNFIIDQNDALDSAATGSYNHTSYYHTIILSPSETLALLEQNISIAPNTMINGLTSGSNDATQTKIIATTGSKVVKKNRTNQKL